MAVSKRIKIRDPQNPDIGVITGTYAPDWETGATAYRITARRVSGAFVVTPQPCYHEPAGTPDRHYLSVVDVDRQYVMVDYGTGGCWSPYDREDRPVVNGVTLTGGTGIDLDRLRQGRLRRGHIVCRRGRYAHAEAPDATCDRTAIVVDCLLRHWMTRPENYALRLAACRASAEGIAKEAAGDIEWATGLLEEAQRQLDRARALAELAEAHASAPVAGPTAPPARPRIVRSHPGSGRFPSSLGNTA